MTKPTVFEPPKRPLLADGFFVEPASNGGWVVKSKPVQQGYESTTLAAVSNNEDLKAYIAANIATKPVTA